MMRPRSFNANPSADLAAHPGTRLAPGTPRTVLAALSFLLVIAGCSTVQTVRAKWHIYRGENFIAAEQFETALRQFEKAAELAPQLPKTHSRMGFIYRKLGEYERAVDCFVEAIRRDPFSFDDALNLAQLYDLMERITDAIQAYLHAVHLQPENFDAQINLGVCYQKTGEFTRAAERFNKAIEIDPDRPHAYVNLGVALEAQEKHYAAIRAYKDALERDANQPLVLINLAYTYMKQDRLKMARGSLEQALKLDPEFAAAHEALGYCLFRTRDFDLAELSYQDALARDWHLPRAHAGLGSIAMLRFLRDSTRTDLRARALEHWHRSLELDPDQPRIRDLIDKYAEPIDNPEQALLEGQSEH
ncbi:MAG: tetratricopeptide repeat protein [Phycisphaerae bacterium]|jgi:tetratricopeptide (TPR) repeat protein